MKERRFWFVLRFAWASTDLYMDLVKVHFPLPGTISGTQGASQTKVCPHEAINRYPISMQSHVPLPPPQLYGLQIQQLSLKWLWAEFPGPVMVLGKPIHLFSSDALGGHSQLRLGEAGQGKSYRSGAVARTKLTDSHAAGTCDLRHSRAIINWAEPPCPRVKTNKSQNILNYHLSY